MRGFDTWGMGPPPAAAKAAGFQWRTWYSSYDRSKDGPVDGPAQYAAEGIWSVCNFETTTDRVSGGYAGGQQDMMHAINEYVPRGMPVGAVVILSADEAIGASAFPQALAYYQGARQAAGGQYLTGCYGEQALIAYLKQHSAIDIGWRTMSSAWPGGASTAFCDLVQTGGGSISGVSVDLDEAVTPFFGQWMPGKLAPHGGVTVSMTPDEMTAEAQVIENRPVGDIPATADHATTTLGTEVAENPGRWSTLFARLDELEAKLAALSSPTLDPAALAKALLDAGFAPAVAGVIVAALPTSYVVQPATAVHPIGTPTQASTTA